MFGIRYRDPKEGGHWDADAGLRVRSPLDPFVKGSYRFMKGSSESTLFSFRETVFWQNSEKFGITSRIDIERCSAISWLFRWTGSGTFSERTEGVTRLHLVHAAARPAESPRGRRRVVHQGRVRLRRSTGRLRLKVAYRRSITRDWLVLESRVSLTFPKDEPWQAREATWAWDAGLEMFFGTDEFLARPVTF